MPDDDEDDADLTGAVPILNKQQTVFHQNQ
jgi:hypothetical protein